jgi:hypothetical protein
MQVAGVAGIVGTLVNVTLTDNTDAAGCQAGDRRRSQRVFE